jgi:hypothetical protein
LHDGSSRIAGNRLWWWRLGVLDAIHGHLKHVRFHRYRNLPDLDHAVLGWVVGFFDDNALLLGRFRPVFLEDAFADPFPS